VLRVVPILRPPVVRAPMRLPGRVLLVVPTRPEQAAFRAGLRRPAPARPGATIRQPPARDQVAPRRLGLAVRAAPIRPGRVAFRVA
jgi:hypothetical protein